MKFSLSIFLFFGVLSLHAQTFDTLVLLQSKEVYFDFGKSDIRSDADSILHYLVLNLPEKYDSIYITAHTDSIGNPENNLKLSMRRANAVRDTLIGLGLTDALVQIDVFGEKNPIANNSSEEGRQQNRRATIAIFRKYKMQYVSGQIIDPETGQGIESEVIVSSRISREFIKTDSTGEFKAKAPMGGVVKVDVIAKDYFFETIMQRLSSKKSEIKVQLKPLKEGESVDFKNLYFVGNEAILLEKSEPELPRLLKFMEYNPTIKIEIQGHVNRPHEGPVSTQTFSYRLSVDRAKTVYDYLIDNNISTERLTYKGYGNWKMRYPKARSLEHQAANRRVEIKVLSLD